jgi:hypothetical protein
MDDVARNHVFERHPNPERRRGRVAIGIAAPPDGRRRVHHRSQLLGSGVRAVLLDERQQHRHHDHDGDHDGAVDLAGEVGHDRERDEQQRQRLSEEFEEPDERMFASLVRDHVGSLAFEPTRGLRFGQALCRRAKLGEQHVIGELGHRAEPPRRIFARSRLGRASNAHKPEGPFERYHRLWPP